MAELPLAQGIDRFKQNEDRMDQFTNGSQTQSFTTRGGQSVPSIRKFLKDKDTEINTATDGILAQSEAARDAAQGFATESGASADRAEVALAEAEGAADRSEGAADRAEAAAIPRFKDTQSLLADNTLSYTIGLGKIRVQVDDIVSAFVHSYRVVASGDTSADVVTAGEVSLILLKTSEGIYAVSGLGVPRGENIGPKLNAFYAKLRNVGLFETACIDGYWTSNESIRIPFNVRQVKAGEGQIRAALPFTGVTFDRTDNATPTPNITAFTVNAVFWCAETPPVTPGRAALVGSNTGSRRDGVFIDDGLIIDCRRVADYGIFTDNIQNSYFGATVLSPQEYGVFDFWYGWGNVHNESVLDERVGGIWIRNGGNGIKVGGNQVWGSRREIGQPGFPNREPNDTKVRIEGDNNGCTITVGFLEKGNTAITLVDVGPTVVNGIDFEQFTGPVVVVSGSGISGRVAGPVTVNASFLETSSPLGVVKATNAHIIVNASRIRNTAGKQFIESAGAQGTNPTTVAPFQVTDASSVIQANVNVIEPSIAKLNVPGVIYTSQSGRTSSRKIVRDSVASVTTIDENVIHADPYNYNLPMAYDRVETSVTNTGTQEVVARRTQGVSVHRGALSVGEVGWVHTAFNGEASLQTLPLNDNLTQLGSSSFRIKVAYFGTAAVVTSDKRLKNVLSENIPDALLDAWQKNIKYGVYSFKNDTDEKQRPGLFAQDIISAFEEAGIDWREWAILEEDDKGFYHVVKDEAQAIENAMVRRKIALIT